MGYIFLSLITIKSITTPFSNSVNGIDATPGSSNNNVHNNVIMNSKIAMLTDKSSPGNTFSSNKIK